MSGPSTKLEFGSSHEAAHLLWLKHRYLTIEHKLKTTSPIRRTYHKCVRIIVAIIFFWYHQGRGRPLLASPRQGFCECSKAWTWSLPIIAYMMRWNPCHSVIFVPPIDSLGGGELHWGNCSQIPQWSFFHWENLPPVPPKGRNLHWENWSQVVTHGVFLLTDEPFFLGGGGHMPRPPIAHPPDGWHISPLSVGKVHCPQLCHQSHAQFRYNFQMEWWQSISMHDPGPSWVGGED